MEADIQPLQGPLWRPVQSEAWALSTPTLDLVL
jgi:hypothetical protein